MESNWYSHESEGRKRDWLSQRRKFSWRYPKMELNKIFSKKLPKRDDLSRYVSEIWRVLYADSKRGFLCATILFIFQWQHTYYPVYCPSFPHQRRLESATCLDGLIAFLHLTRSWAKEVYNRSSWRSLLMKNNLMFCV